MLSYIRLSSQDLHFLAILFPSCPSFLSHRIINSLKIISILDDICSLVKVFLYINRHRDHVIITNSGKISFSQAFLSFLL